MSIFETADQIRRGSLTATDAVEAMFERIDEHNPRLNAVVVADRDRARQLAGHADERRRAGDETRPFDGVPITVKEQFNVAGWATTLGMPALADNVAARNDEVIDRLEALGFIVVGKTNVPFALSDHQTFNPLFGRTVHPFDDRLTPGGSSGGAAAALASGITDLELGSDIGGSLRVPAHFCGVYSHKPTHGLINWCMPGTATHEDVATPGPMATDPRALTAVLGHLVGDRDRNVAPSPLAPPTIGDDLAGVRVGVWADDDRCPISAEYRATIEAFADRLAAAGCSVDGAIRPDNDAGAAAATGQALMWGALSANLPTKVIDIYGVDWQDHDPDDWSFVACRARGLGVPHHRWHELDDRRWRDAAAWRRLFEQVDVMVLPVHLDGAFEHDPSDPAEARTLDVNGQTRIQLEAFFWLMQAHPAGFPATTVPVGATSDGRPLGVQVIADRHRDTTSLRFAELVHDLDLGSG